MKNKIIIAAVLAAALSLTACGKKPTESSVSSADTTSDESIVAADSESQSEDESEVESETASESEAESAVESESEVESEAEPEPETSSEPEQAEEPEDSSIDPSAVPETSIGDFKIELSMDEDCYRIVTYLGNEEVVKIPSSANGLPVTGVVFDAFKDNTSVKTVIIPETFDFISRNVFAGCTNLENVIILSSNVEILSGAFDDCGATVTYNGREYTSADFSEIYSG